MSCHVMSCHGISRLVISCHHVMSSHVLSRLVMSRHVTSCHVMSCRVTCYTYTCHVTAYHVLSYHVIMSRIFLPSLLNSSTSTMAAGWPRRGFRNRGPGNPARSDALAVAPRALRACACGTVHIFVAFAWQAAGTRVSGMSRVCRGCLAALCRGNWVPGAFCTRMVNVRFAAGCGDRACWEVCRGRAAGVLAALPWELGSRRYWTVNPRGRRSESCGHLTMNGRLLSVFCHPYKRGYAAGCSGHGIRTCGMPSLFLRLPGSIWRNFVTRIACWPKQWITLNSSSKQEAALSDLGCDDGLRACRGVCGTVPWGLLLYVSLVWQEGEREDLHTIFFVSCALISLSLSVTGERRRKTKRGQRRCCTAN